MPTIPESIPVNLQTITATALSFVIAIGSTMFFTSKIQKRIDRNNHPQITVDVDGRPVEVNIKKIDSNGYIYEVALLPEERNSLCEKCRRSIALEDLGSNEGLSERGNEKARVRGDMQVLFGSSKYIKIFDRNFGGRELSAGDILCRDSLENLDSLEFRLNDRLLNITNEIKASAIQDAQAKFLIRRGILRRNPAPAQPQHQNA